jgi:YidC/Oxa1 family membrane protein insertase
MGEDQRNLFIALGLSFLVMVGYQVIFAPSAEERLEAERAAQELALTEAVQSDLPGVVASLEADTALDREEALSSSQRIEIETDSVEGTLALTGARFDDLRLRHHTVDVGGDELISLLNPAGGENSFYARDGWVSSTPGVTGLPGSTTEWALVAGNRLTPTTPITLRYESESGLMFERQITVDDTYLFTVTDIVSNTTSSAIELSRYGLVRQGSMPEDLEPNLTVFEGAIAVVGDRRYQRKYDKLEGGDGLEEGGTGGWVGITDRYWMAATIPNQDRAFTAEFQGIDSGNNTAFQASYLEMAQSLAPGASLTSTSRIFAGAKELDVLEHIQNDIGIAKFDMAINWGWLWFLARPFVWLLHLLAGMTGHFGLAILALTLMIKILMYPLANKAYASMARMKMIAPKVAELKERYAADQQKLQQATMELYKTEKINPLAGCLPVLPQIPIFFALYQTLFNSLEMRHAPFFGWIQDLAAPDPTSMWNLFGALPFDPSGWPILGGILAIGAWPIIMGITMAAQQALNPPPPDPIQAKIFAFLPFVFTIILAPFAAGLVIYWAWNNFLTVLQQYVIMRRAGNETQVDKLFAKLMGKSGADESGDKS